MNAKIVGIERIISLWAMNEFDIYLLRKMKKNLLLIDPAIDDITVYQWVARKCTDLIQKEIALLTPFALYGIYCEVIRLTFAPELQWRKRNGR